MVGGTERSLEAWRDWHEWYEASEIEDVWIFGHLPPHLRRPRHDDRDPDVVVLGSVLRDMLDAERDVYFVDPD